MPKDRAAALKNAFNQMGKDPGFLSDAKKMNFLVDPISGTRCWRSSSARRKRRVRS